MTGIYINSALAKTEAWDHGLDEAIMLTQEGNVCEGSGENIFLLTGGRLVTPPPSEGILVGITRNTIMELAQTELGLETVERQIPRSELYTADEVFMTGTAAHVTPVIEVDARPVGSGSMGEITQKLMQSYRSIIHGDRADRKAWVTAVPAD